MWIVHTCTIIVITMPLHIILVWSIQVGVAVSSRRVKCPQLKQKPDCDIKLITIIYFIMGFCSKMSIILSTSSFENLSGDSITIFIKYDRFSKTITCNTVHAWSISRMYNFTQDFLNIELSIPLSSGLLTWTKNSIPHNKSIPRLYHILPFLIVQNPEGPCPQI